LDHAKPSAFALFIYKYRQPVLATLRFFIFIVSILSIGTFVYYHGFIHTEAEKEWLRTVTSSVFLFFIFSYLVRLLLSQKKADFFNETWVEAILLSILFYDIVNNWLFGFKLLDRLFIFIRLPHLISFYTGLIQLYLLFLVGKEFVRGLSRNFSAIRLRPATLFIGAYITIILVGSVLLMLPGVSNDGSQMNYLDSLFTSVSASCVCGLQVQGITTFFNTKGQLIILTLIQLGGIGIISFATFFASFIRKGMSLKHQSVLKSVFDSESLEGSSFRWKQIILVTVVIEVLGAIALYVLWQRLPWTSTAQHIYFSVFHAVSGFCNASFSLFPDNFRNESLHSFYIVHLCMAAIVFFGALGFPAIRDIFSVKNLRARAMYPWKKWKVSTQIALNTSLAIIFAGTIGFYYFEENHLLEDQNGMEGVITSLFQVVNARTGGFTTVDLSAATYPTLLLLCLIMFVGASSGGTGGGIKTSSAAVIIRTVMSGLRNRKTTTIARRNINQQLILKAFTIYIIASLVIFFSVLMLQYFEPGTAFFQLLFEEVSAFSNVGFTLGITPHLTTASKVTLMISMFIGRVGILSVAYALSVKKDETNFTYPDTHIMIG
jgi:trk system potassium uptake protein TrkH